MVSSCSVVKQMARLYRLNHPWALGSLVIW